MTRRSGGSCAHATGGTAVAHATAFLQQVQENKYYADLAGTRTTQQRVRLQPHFEAMGTDEATGVFDSMASIAPPVGRGWEYLTNGHDWDAELVETPELLAEIRRRVLPFAVVARIDALP